MPQSSTSPPETNDVYVSTTAVRASHAADWATLASNGKRTLAFASHKRAAVVDTDSPNPVQLLPVLGAKINVLKFHSHPSGRSDANPLIVCGLDDSSIAIYSFDVTASQWTVAATLIHPAVDRIKAKTPAAQRGLTSTSAVSEASVQALAVVRPDVQRRGAVASSLLVSGHIDGSLCLWSLKSDPSTGDISAELQQTASLVDAPGSTRSKGSVLPMDAALAQLSCSQDEAWILAVGGTDSRISLWTVKRDEAKLSLTPVLAITGHSDWVRSLDFVRPSLSSDKLLLASGGQDHAIRLWALTPSQSSTPQPVPPSQTDDFDRLASQVEAKASERDELDTAAKEFRAGPEGTTWAVRLEALLSAHDSWITGVRWAPRSGGQQPSALLSSSSDNSVILWTPSGASAPSQDALPTFSEDVETDGDKNQQDGPGIWIPAHRFGELGIVGSVAHGMMGALWRPSLDEVDGKAAQAIYAHGWNGALHLWTREEGEGGWKTRPAPTGHYKAARSVRWEPEGKYFLSAGADRTSRIHALCTREDGERSETPTWHEVARPQTHGHDVQSVAWVNRVAFVSAAEEKVVRAFEAPSNFVESMRALGTLGGGGGEGAYDVLGFNFPSLAHLRSPSHLSGAIKEATEHAASEARPRKLLILAISSAFNGCHNNASRAPQLGFDDAEAFLKWAYAQAWKVAIDRGRMLMEVDVLFVPEDVAGKVVAGWVESRNCKRFWTVEETSASLPFLTTLKSGPKPERLASSGTATPSAGVTDPPPAFPQHRCVALGGTFDHLHVGHKILLSVSALIATERIVIGVTDDKMLTKKKNAHLLEDLPTRLARVDAFIRRFKSSLTPLRKQDVVQLSDVCGPAGTDPDIQGLVVTDETIAGADMIDAERKKNGLGSLERHVIGVIGSGGETDVKGKDAAELAAGKVGSTAIRAWLAEKVESGESVEVKEEDSLDLGVNAPLRTTNTDMPIGASVPPLALSNRAIFPEQQQQPASTGGEGGNNAASTTSASASTPAQASNSVAVFRRPPTEEELHVSSVWAELHKVYGPPLELLSVDVSSDGKWLASSCQGKTEAHSAVHLHDVEARWAERQVLKGHALGVERVRFSPHGGDFLVTASRDRSWRLYRRRGGRGTQEGGEPWTLVAKEGKAHARIVYDVAWCPTQGKGRGGERRFVTASRDKTIKVWGFSDHSASRVGEMKGDKGTTEEEDEEVEIRLVSSTKLDSGATAVAWSEGATLAVGCEDGTLLLFGIGNDGRGLASASKEEGEEGGEGQFPRLLKKLPHHHTEAVSEMEWRPTVADTGTDARDQTLVTAGDDGVVRLLRVRL